jgi:hypothetical protein
MPELFVIRDVSWQVDNVKRGKTKSTGPLTAAQVADEEARQLHETGKRIAADRKLALRLLAATGMYTATGKLKARFR